MSVSQFYVGKIDLYVMGSTVISAGRGRSLRAAAPAAWASPGCDDGVLPVFDGYPARVDPRHRIRPRPHWGQGWRKGGWQDTGNSASAYAVRPCSYLESDCPQNFLAFRIFIQKYLAVRTFVRNFFGFFNFQTEKIAGKLSVQKFSGNKNFMPNDRVRSARKIFRREIHFRRKMSRGEGFYGFRGISGTCWM